MFLRLIIIYNKKQEINNVSTIMSPTATRGASTT